MKTIQRFFIGILLLTVSTFLGYDAHGTPVKPGPITVTQPDGTTVTIRAYGDEWSSYATTEDGYGVAMAEDGYLYYLDNQGKMMSVRAKNASARTSADRAAMRGASMGVPFDRITSEHEQAQAARAAYVARQPRKAPVLGTHKGLVLLIDFPNKHFITSEVETTSYFNDYLNGTNFTQNGATGSVQQYYKDNSNGQFTPQFTLDGIYSAPQNIGTYGNKSGSNNIPSLLRTVLQQMVSEGFDFSPYATSGTNLIDNLFIIFAGNDCAASGGVDNNKIWPHQWYVGVGVSNDGYYSLGGYKFGTYACVTELGGSGTAKTGIGTCCHEFGHAIGLPDYYDYNYGATLEPSSYFVMSSGNYNNDSRTPPSLSAINRLLLGWITPEVLALPGNYTLDHISKNKAYMIRISGSGDDGEYFLLETRSTSSGDKWDAGMLKAQNWSGLGPRDGLFVMQIDRRNPSQWNDLINSNESHPYARPITAVSPILGTYGFTNQNRWVFPQSGVTSLNSTTHPNFASWQGTNKHELSNISFSGGKVSFTLSIDGFQLPSVSFDNSSISAYVGDSLTLDYTTDPEGVTVPLEWKSSNSNVVEVDNSGRITCRGIGKATITLSSPSLSNEATCDVTVSSEIRGRLDVDVDNSNKKAVVSWLPATNRNEWIVRWRTKGGSFVQLDPTRETSATLSPLVWGTEYEVAVSAVRPDNSIWGETTATFRSEQPSATGVELTKTTLDAHVGDMQALEYRILPEDGVATLIWESSDPSVVSVDDDGAIKPLKAGKATITVSSNDFSGKATCAVTVAAEIESNIAIEVDNFERSALVDWTPAVSRPNWIVRWRIDNGEYTVVETKEPSVSLTDLPTGAEGEVLISGERADGEIWGETRATFEITDKPLAKSISLNETKLALFANDEFRLEATVLPENAYNTEVEWSSSNNEVVTVDNNGLVTAVDAGEAVITVKTKLGFVSATCAVTVTMEVAPVNAVTVYQNDVEFEWNGSLWEGAYKVEIFEGDNLLVQKTVDTTYIYIPLLKAGTTYDVVVTADREGGNSSNLEFTTEPVNGLFASMMIEGTYASGEAVPFRITNIQDEVTSIVWRVDGNVVPETEMPAKVLEAGRHELEATITTRSNHKETITKFITVK